MTAYDIEPAAVGQIEDILIYSIDAWGEAKAVEYLAGLYAFFGGVVDRSILWRPTATELGVDGFVGRYRRHFVYWRVLATGDIGIVAVLHERMHQRDRLREVLDEKP